MQKIWIFGDGSPYLETILSMAAAGRTIAAAKDQFASPTGAQELAKIALDLMYHAEDGLYHVTGQGSCSRYEFADMAVRLSGFDARVLAVEAGEDTLSAMRPSCSVLDNMMLRISGMALLPGWKSMLEAYMVRWRKKYQKGSAGR